jgi:nitrate/nitrite-specific signal transduction histidine kinase
MRCKHGKYHLTVDDDGVGIDRRTRSEPQGMGLRIMGFRAKKIGARLEIGRNSLGGARIELGFL